MKQYYKSIIVALVCFLIVIILNFLLPRLLPGNPLAYLTGFAEEDMTVAKQEYYRNALHLNESPISQFGRYLASLADGTLGYSYKKEAVVSSLIRDRLGATLQITLPAWIFSTLGGLVLGLYCGYKKGSLSEKLTTSAMILLNTIPVFLIGLVMIIVFCFRVRWFPYTGLSSADPGTGVSWLSDRIRHLLLPVLTMTLAAAPSRCLLMRNTAAMAADEKYILYARERGLSERRIRYSYLLKNIAQPFITMTGMSVSTCVSGSLVVENIFSINGMGKLLTDAVYTLDYPLMQGILFVTTLIMVLSVIISDLICILIDPKVRLGHES